MRAVICDACGQPFRSYVAKIEDDELGVEANGMTFVEILRDGKIKGKGKLELCPICMERVFNFVFDDLCEEDGPFIEKMKRYAKKRKAQKTMTDNEKEYYENHAEPVEEVGEREYEAVEHEEE